MVVVQQLYTQNQKKKVQSVLRTSEPHPGSLGPSLEQQDITEIPKKDEKSGSVD